MPFIYPRVDCYRRRHKTECAFFVGKGKENKMPKVKLNEIVYDAEIYPRGKWNTHTIKGYTDVLRAGGKFPAIVLEQETGRLLDGVHRWKAYQKYLEEYAEYEQQATLEGMERVDGWAPASNEIEAVHVKVPEGIPVKLFAASFSTQHGDRIPYAQRKAIAREICQENPDFTLATIGKYLDLSASTAHNYVADIKALRREQQKMTAYRLHLLGWTQQEIGEKIGVAQSTYAEQFLSEFSGLEKPIKKLLTEGIPHLDVAERFNMPLQLVWAIDLHGRTDAQRMDRLGIKVQPYDVWSFSKCHELFGAPQYPGRIPGELIAHVLYFYTNPGDKIIDPMVGGGTTLDVCLAFGRECYGYDLESKRSDVIAHDMSKGWPDRIKKANLIFWDPPYYSKKDYADESVSNLSQDECLAFFERRFTEAFGLAKKGTRIAFLMSDWDDGNGGGIFIWDYADLLRQAGWKLIRQIQAPLSTQQVHPDIVNKFRKSRRLARLERYLLIGRK